jgi:hypothetical protein
MADIDLTGFLLAYRSMGIEHDRLTRVTRHLIAPGGVR